MEFHFRFHLRVTSATSLCHRHSVSGHTDLSPRFAFPGWGRVVSHAHRQLGTAKPANGVQDTDVRWKDEPRLVAPLRGRVRRGVSRREMSPRGHGDRCPGLNRNRWRSWWSEPLSAALLLVLLPGQGQGHLYPPRLPSLARFE